MVKWVTNSEVQVNVLNEVNYFFKWSNLFLYFTFFAMSWIYLIRLGNRCPIPCKWLSPSLILLLIASYFFFHFSLIITRTKLFGLRTHIRVTHRKISGSLFCMGGRMQESHSGDIYILSLCLQNAPDYLKVINKQPGSPEGRRVASSGKLDFVEFYSWAKGGLIDIGNCGEEGYLLRPCYISFQLSPSIFQF